jgi:hypothetical protein
MKQRGIKSQRIQKLLALLRAACNVAKMNPNPLYKFEIAEPYRDDEKDVPPYSDDDVALIRANLDAFDREERLMVIWHIASSIRPGGIYSIDCCEWEVAKVGGVERQTRYVWINRDKGKYGRRALPIPKVVLESGLLPERIDGPLFKRDLDVMLATINRKLTKMGVNVGGKTLYSGRHRARDRLDDLECVERMSRAIMGHARKIEPHDRYGHGFRMWKLQPFVDGIGL